MGRRISNSKEQFYYSLIENERLKDMEIFNVLKEKYTQYKNPCIFTHIIKIHVIFLSMYCKKNTWIFIMCVKNLLIFR